MKHLIKKAFSLQDIRYRLILLVSAGLFAVTLYADLSYLPSVVQFAALAGYGVAFVLAVLWGILNYVDHILINAIYRQNKDIGTFVDNLALAPDEKLELRTYLEDYVQDLIRQGKSAEEATVFAIGQFKTKEFSALSKNTAIFNLHAHYYLWGCAAIALTAGAILAVAFPATLAPRVLGYTGIAYGIGLAGMFFVYKAIDLVLHRKLDIE